MVTTVVNTIAGLQQDVKQAWPARMSGVSISSMQVDQKGAKADSIQASPIALNTCYKLILYNQLKYQ